jgi:hypothetical protein
MLWTWDSVEGAGEQRLVRRPYKIVHFLLFEIGASL